MPPAATARPLLPTALPSVAARTNRPPQQEVPNSTAPRNRLPPQLTTGMRGPDASPAPKSQREKKVAELPAGSWEPEAADPTGEAHPAARRSPHLARRLRALTPGRAEGTAGHLLGTRFPTGRSSRFSNKFQGGRRRPKKNPIMQMAPDWEARAGSDAVATARVREQPGRRIYGARHGYARSRRRASQVH